MNHEVDLLLSCGCIMLERIEAVVFLPQAGETRRCIKHKRTATILKVGQPYWADNEKTTEKKKDNK